jgi:hypothetical protein
LNRSPVLAVGLAVAAIVVWRVRFGRSLKTPEIDALMIQLQDARAARTVRETGSAATRATVMANVIALPMQSPRRARWTGTATMCRDEVSEDRWRQLITALRHQPRQAESAAQMTKSRSA